MTFDILHKDTVWNVVCVVSLRRTRMKLCWRPLMMFRKWTCRRCSRLNRSPGSEKTLTRSLVGPSVCVCVCVCHWVHWEVLYERACLCVYSSDDVDYRSSHTNIAQASGGPFTPQQMAASSSMPWLGSGQTSMGASVVCLSRTNSCIVCVFLNRYDEQRSGTNSSAQNFTYRLLRSRKVCFLNWCI